VQGFPTLKFFKKSFEIDYSGDRDVTSVVAWLGSRATGSLLKVAKTESELLSVLDGSEYPSVVGFPCPGQLKPFTQKLGAMAEEGAVSSKIIYAVFMPHLVPSSVYAAAKLQAGSCGFVLFYHRRAKVETGYLRGDDTSQLLASDMPPKPVLISGGTATAKLEGLANRVAGELFPLVLDFGARQRVLTRSMPIKLRGFLFVDKGSGGQSDAADSAVAATKAVARKFRGQFQLVLVDVPAMRAGGMEGVMKYFQVEDAEVSVNKVVFVVEDGRGDEQPTKKKYSGSTSSERELMSFVSDSVKGNGGDSVKGNSGDDDDELHDTEKGKEKVDSGVLQHKDARSSSTRDPRARLKGHHSRFRLRGNKRPGGREEV
jgi:hypothetical protein